MRQIPVCGNDTRPGGHFDQIDVLDAELAARFAGPDAGCWRDAVGSALSPTRRHAPRDVYALEDEPDVSEAPVASETCSAHSGPTPAPRGAPCRSSRPGWSRRTASCGRSVSFALARRSGRRPSQQVAPTWHRAPARPAGLARTGCASAARSLSISRPQYRRCDRVCTAAIGKAALEQSLRYRGDEANMTRQRRSALRL